MRILPDFTYFQKPSEPFRAVKSRLKSRHLFFGNNLFSSLSQSVCNRLPEPCIYNLTPFGLLTVASYLSAHNNDKSTTTYIITPILVRL